MSSSIARHPFIRPCVPLASATARGVETLERRQMLAGNVSPFPEQTPSVPDNAVLFANFDNGGEGVSFHDTDDRNRGKDYRRTDIGVDIKRNTDDHPTDTGDAPGIGRSVAYTRAGEWLNYTIEAPNSGIYEFQLRYASAVGGTVHLEVDGINVSGAIDLGSTGGWNSWTTVEKLGINLAAGVHTMKFFMDSSVNGTYVADFHWFRFTESVPQNHGHSSPTAWPDTWDRIADAPAARYEPLTSTIAGKVFVFGGYETSDFKVARDYSVFDAATRSWQTLGTLPQGMAETHAAPVNDGRYVYFAGGFAGDIGQYANGASQIASDRVYRYDTQTNEWELLTRLPAPQGAGGTTLIGRELHVIGGNSADRVTNVGTHLVLDLDNVEAGWRTAAAMPDAKDHFSTVALNGRIYTIGGEHGHDKYHDVQKSVHLYDPADDTWRRLADLPIASGHAEGTTFIRDGRIIFAGGQTDPHKSASDRVFSYDPAGDRWTELAPLPYYLQGAVATIFDNKVIVTQGSRFAVDPSAATFIGTL